MGTHLPQNRHSHQFSAHVYCGQTAGWIKMPLGTEVPGHIVRWEQSPTPRLLWPNGWMDQLQDATWYGGNLGPGDTVLDGDPASLTESGTPASHFSAHVYRARQVYKNISMLFLFPVTINLLFSCCLVYTARTGRLHNRTRPCSRPVRPCTRAVYTAVYTVRVHGCVQGPFPRPRTGRIHMYATVYTPEYGPYTRPCSGHLYGRVHGPYTYTAVYTWPVYTAVYTIVQTAVYWVVYWASIIIWNTKLS